MLFNSAAFLWFLALIVPVACFLHSRALVYWLLFCSYWFYGYADPSFLPLLLLSTTIDYVCGIRIYRSTGNARKLWLTLSVITNLGILVWFKYSGLLVDATFAITNLLGLTNSNPVINIALPIGISFFTFQSMSYSIDIYLGKTSPHKSFIELAHFVAFFPQLVAGPIVRAREFLPQIANASVMKTSNVVSGIELILFGFFKKVVIADNIAPAVDKVFANPTNFNTVELWMAAFGFSVQILCDFSGYTDIARGLARCLGYELPINFRWPYFSFGFRDFWRRWHISLSSFIRDYLYVPLGGNQLGIRYYTRNMLITWFLAGLWHGANYTFICWGLFNGILIFLESMVRGRLVSMEISRAQFRVVGIALTFALTITGWVVFRAPTLDLAIDYWAGMFGFNIAPSSRALDRDLKVASLIGSLFFCAHLVSYRLGIDGSKSIILGKLPVFARILSIAIAIATIVLFSREGRPFIYFQF